MPHKNSKHSLSLYKKNNTKLCICGLCLSPSYTYSHGRGCIILTWLYPLYTHGKR